MLCNSFSRSFLARTGAALALSMFGTCAFAGIVLSNDNRTCVANAGGCDNDVTTDADAPAGPFLTFGGGAFAGAGGWSTSEATQASYFDDDFWYGNGGCSGGTGQECDEMGHIDAASVAAFDFTVTGLHSFHVIVDLGAGMPTCEARMSLLDPNSDELFDYLVVGNTTPDDDIHTTWSSLLSNGTYHFDAHVTGESDGGNFGGAGFQYQITVTRCIADFNLDGVVDFNDYLDFVDAYSMNDPSADINGDSVIDHFDYLDFVDHFSTGC